MINIIVAVTANMAIGKENRLLYHISADLKHFKELTTGNTIIMGRKTYDSLPKGALPYRKNIVLTHQKSVTIPGVTVANSLTDALCAAEGDIFIIGGAMLYNMALDKADRIYLTEIDAKRDDADTFFPSIDPEKWRRKEETPWYTDSKTGVNYRFTTLEKI